MEQEAVAAGDGGTGVAGVWGVLSLSASPCRRGGGAAA